MVRYYNQNDNIIISNNFKIDNDNKNESDTYKKEQKQEPKWFSYCWKCLRDFSEPSVMPFCDQGCMNEYYHEIAREENACYREWIGMD